MDQRLPNTQFLPEHQLLQSPVLDHSPVDLFRTETTSSTSTGKSHYRTSSFTEKYDEEEYDEVRPLVQTRSDPTQAANTTTDPTNRKASGSKVESPLSPSIPISMFKRMRPSTQKHVSSGSMSGISSVDVPRGSVEDTDTLSPQKAHMIRGKWVSSRCRTAAYLFMTAAAATTFALVLGVYRVDYLPTKNSVSEGMMYSGGSYVPMPAGAPGRGFNIRAWPDNLDLKGVYLILAFCGSGMVVFFGLWLQNIFRSAKSYYVRFTKTEVFSLIALIVYGIGFGATAGYVTWIFKIENNYSDFWSYTCSRGGMAQEQAFKYQIRYDGDCHMLTGSWITLLVLCGFSFLALLTFPINLIYHARVKNAGYSRFEQRLSKEADQEERMAKRMALRPKEPWKMPKWAQGKQ